MAPRAQLPCMSRPRCTGVILAGGEAVRFDGRPKGLELVAGRRIVDRVADALRPVTDDLLLVANDADASRWIADAHVVRDVLPQRGSLAGLYSALVSAAGALLVVAWDMPFLSSALLAALREEGERHESVVVPEADGRVQPFCAYYPHSAIATVNRMLESDDRRMTSFLGALPHLRRFDHEWLRQFGVPDTLFLNVNTHDDLERARAVANAAQRA
jgi:molybdenum cofactor guanylyltransferase